MYGFPSIRRRKIIGPVDYLIFKNGDDITAPPLTVVNSNEVGVFQVGSLDDDNPIRFTGLWSTADSDSILTSG